MAGTPSIRTLVGDAQASSRDAIAGDASAVDACIHERFAAQAARTPQAIALTLGAISLTYAELDARANQLAHLLREHGVGPEVRVGLYVERSIEMVVGLIAILKAGGAYVPVDVASPPDRIAFLLEDAAVPVLLTQLSLRERLPAHAAHVICLDACEPLAAQSTAPLASGATPGSLAYVIYTSGSTGKPKGVLVEHRNVTRLFTATEAWYGFGPSDAWTLFHSHAFDFSVWELWGALLYGGRVVVVPFDVSRDPDAFHRLLVREGVTVLNQTPSAFQQLVAADARSPEAGRLALRWVIFGGEALEPASLRGWFERHGDERPRLVNMYGITETTVHVTYRPLSRRDAEGGSRSVIGVPIPDLYIRLLDESGGLVPAGVPGEICVGGAGVARGYLNRDALTAQRFVRDPFSPNAGARLYRSGDLAQRTADGDLEYLGRIDQQVKIRGFRIELGEIEAVIARHAAVRTCAVIARDDMAGGLRLVAYVVPAGGELPVAALHEHLRAQLPEYMVPAALVAMASLPLTENGKLDRRALPKPAAVRPELAQPYRAPVGEAEERLCRLFAALLGIDRVGRDDNFFELGGNSLLVGQATATLAQEAGRDVPAALFFRDPTPAAIAAALGAESASTIPRARRVPGRNAAAAARQDIAIIAMAGRFPGAGSVEAFWENLCAGRDTLKRFAPGELDASIPAAVRDDPAYVPARGVVDDVEMFDAEFFGIAPREAELMDPQQRLFMELCWECLERGGYVPDACPGPVGVFGGMYNASYLQHHVARHPGKVALLGEFQVMLANDKDFIATRTANRLNLTGPAISVHTACSTSLVAIAQAVASLRAGQCDMALAGGAAVTCPPASGYLAQEGAMLSPDGHTRTFDAGARGTVFSDGAAVVLLKRLDAAIADGDPVYAVIRGVGVNNDGGAKASFTAPSVDGQAAVIAAALDDAAVDARTIGYIEAHGTATPLGDPVEIEALTQAFRRQTADAGFCRIGSVKSNVGHLTAAAGATGLIKTALSLADSRIPPSLHFTAPNPKLGLEATPFRVNAELAPWPRGSAPRRAGVSSFGVGGTNAHVVLEEAPPAAPAEPGAGPQLLLLSARTPAALQKAAERLAGHLAAHPEEELADIAYTLRVGRKPFAQRLCVVADSAEAAVAALRDPQHDARVGGVPGDRAPEVAFMFPGQAAQYAGMGSQLHREEPAFREAFDTCVAALDGVIDFDLASRMFSGDAAALTDTAVTQPALFCMEYALARHWLALGLAPAALVGHSVGEFVAATVAGVFSAADAVRLVARRGRLMGALPGGAMLAVRASASDVVARMPAPLCLAAENSPSLCVVAGPTDAIDAFRVQLEALGINARMLQTSHAFHSAMMDAAIAPFEAEVRRIELSPPKIPLISTVTGRALADSEACDPAYWARHLRETVRFSSALQALCAGAPRLLLEIGPRATLTTLARQHGTRERPAPAAMASLADAPERETASLRLAAGRLWTQGASLHLERLDRRTRKRRVLLPTYPFERKRFWVGTEATAIPSPAAALALVAPAAASAPLPPPTPEVAAMTTSMPTATPSRIPALVAQLRTMLEDISGIAMEDADPGVPLVELGLDSLSLTQVALQVKQAFKVSLTFRQLMESYRTLDALAAFLDGAMPAAPAPAPVPVAAAPAAAAPASAVPGGLAMTPFLPATGTPPGSLLEQVIRGQMQLMAQQIALLQGAASGAYAAAMAPAPATVSTPVAAPIAIATTAPAATAPTPAATEEEAPSGPGRYDVKKAFGAIARIHTDATAITDRQRARLEAFMRRYVARTRLSKEYTQAHRAHLADPRVVNGFRPLLKEIVYQVVVGKSKGAHVWDLDGNEYVDVLSGFGMSLFGWQPDFVLEAVRAQLDAGYEIGPQHPFAGEVAKGICELTGFDRAGLCNTGSEAVLGAIRIARTVTGRNTIVLFTGSYHGINDEVIVRATRKLRAVPAAPGILPNTSQNVLVLDYGTPESLEIIRARASELAAVLVEPVQSRRPDFQPREFIRELRTITAESGALLILDEVVTGFRSHPGGVQALFDVRADVCTYGKVLGGGFPIGVIAGKREYMDALDGGGWQYGDDSIPTAGVTYFAGTFVRHPLALAAAKAVIAHLKARGPELQATLTRNTAAMVDELNAFCREVGAPVVLKTFASLWKTFFTEDHPLQDLLFPMMRSRGIHILDNFPCFLTTAHTAADIAAIKTAFKESIRELQEADFLPRRAPAERAFDASRPPVPGARIGRDAEGRPAWFVPNPEAPRQYMRIDA